MTTNIDIPMQALEPLGFTEIEAAIYCELLRGPAATGYRLAKVIGKAPANTYQALASLASKGAVMIDDGETETYRSTPPAELLTGLQRAFDASLRKAQTALESLHAPVEDDRIYQLKPRLRFMSGRGDDRRRKKRFCFSIFLPSRWLCSSRP